MKYHNESLKNDRCIMYRFFRMHLADCGLRIRFKKINRMEGDCKFDFDVDIPTEGRYY
ncbi:hypothetical protein J21TS7_47480 [Paenibacillus cineris]|uniref:Uncharacterized protein n=1 Tax=Paenibacillus cineris TaxID=237530 RepID=A0ABQ4LJK2_9BACL|nr:hypothetical protein J21TS7_47480 [Paenibacillus cineris]